MEKETQNMEENQSEAKVQMTFEETANNINSLYDEILEMNKNHMNLLYKRLLPQLTQMNVALTNYDEKKVEDLKLINTIKFKDLKNNIEKDILYMTEHLNG